MCIRDSIQAGPLGGGSPSLVALSHCICIAFIVLSTVSYTHLRAHETPEHLGRRLPPRSTLDRSSAASDVYKRQYSGRAARRWQSFVGRVESLYLHRVHRPI